MREILLNDKGKGTRALFVFANHVTEYFASQAYTVFQHRQAGITLVNRDNVIILSIVLDGRHTHPKWKNVMMNRNLLIGVVHPHFEVVMIDGKKHVKLYLDRPVMKIGLFTSPAYSEEWPRIAVVEREDEAEYIETGRKSRKRKKVEEETEETPKKKYISELLEWKVFTPAPTPEPL